MITRREELGPNKTTEKSHGPLPIYSLHEKEDIGG
jgi:hypothetical protein